MVLDFRVEFVGIVWVRGGDFGVRFRFLVFILYYNRVVNFLKIDLWDFGFRFYGILEVILGLIRVLRDGGYLEL